MDKISFHPIGVIHSPHKKPVGTPIQPTAALGIRGQIEIMPEYIEGIKDLEEFSYIILLYHFNQVQKVSLTVTPFLDSKPHGVFATRAPTRPNPIGLSIVHLTRIDKNILYVEDIDILDGTPILDIKPYIDNIDVRSSDKQGWIKSKIVELPKKTDDGRFLS